jgi:hypothetical protein
MCIPPRKHVIHVLQTAVFGNVSLSSTLPHKEPVLYSWITLEGKNMIKSA